jgi:hypothetical protein
MVSTNASNCPKCGLPNEPGADKAQLNNDTNNNSSNSANVMCNKPKAWSTSEMFWNLLIAFALPVIGIGIGIYGLFNENRKKQGIIILIVALVGWLIAIIFGAFIGFLSVLSGILTG